MARHRLLLELRSTGSPRTPLAIQINNDQMTLAITRVPQVYLHGVIDADAPLVRGRRKLSSLRRPRLHSTHDFLARGKCLYVVHGLQVQP